jgi:hypothetical protein
LASEETAAAFQSAEKGLDLRPKNDAVVCTSAMSMRFSEVAKQAFSYLDQAGFHLTQIDPDRLQYETTHAFVTVEWDARSGELNVFFGFQPRTGEKREAFSLTDLLAMENVDVPERKMPFQVADKSKLRPFLDKMAEDMRVHAQPALAGDRMFFYRLNAFRSAQAQTHMRDMESQRVRMEADKAWQKRDLEKLIDLYSLIEDRLTAAEKSKLAYARKHQVQ